MLKTYGNCGFEKISIKRQLACSGLYLDLQLGQGEFFIVETISNNKRPMQLKLLLHYDLLKFREKRIELDAANKL